ncbi:flavin-containing monooxygenase [Enemella sp. A6]|uniref:flavin-containing monooxygenase n=1 Tax=Enemella sp. A6 TaxID=3440152 RepID=UPI003EBE2283
MTGRKTPEVDAVVIGAGFAGLYAVHLIREHGFSLRGFEAGEGVGGTWYWNRYPGARCDVESLEYQYRFTPELVREWTWSERYATQPEILSYAEWVADRLDVRKEFSFGEPIVRAVWDEENHLWTVDTASGTSVTARFIVAGSGSISAPQLPDYEGVTEYRGEVYHTGRWPAENPDFSGKRVGVMGVGSSGVQVIPELAKVAEELVVFQRTPAYTLPARNRPLYADEIQYARRFHDEIMERADASYSGHNAMLPGHLLTELGEQERTVLMERNWKLGGNLFISAFPDIRHDPEANRIMSDFVRGKLHQIVEDPETARKLTPTTYPIGTKRIITDTDYWATYNQPHVHLVNLPEEPILRFTPDGIQTAEHTYELDALVMATGYDNLTGALTRIDLRGRGGETLKDSWADGVHTYLGIATAGFPNLFMLTGPQSPSVIVNMFPAIEQHVDWTVATMSRMRADGHTLIEADPGHEHWWFDQVEEEFNKTLYPRANSWYSGANVPGKKRQAMMYMGGLHRYRELCNEVLDDDLRGFRLEA